MESLFKIKLLREGAKNIEPATDGAAGFDLQYVPVVEEFNNAAILAPNARAIFGTGIAIELPYGFAAFVQPRSGLAAKHGITVLNSPGLIDSDYRGEVGVILYNSGIKNFWIQPGDRIAQLVIVPIITPIFRVVESLEETDRGEGGFGSTDEKES